MSKCSVTLSSYKNEYESLNTLKDSYHILPTTILTVCSNKVPTCTYNLIRLYYFQFKFYFCINVCFFLQIAEKGGN